MTKKGRVGLSPSQKAEIWKQWGIGESQCEIGRLLGLNSSITHPQPPAYRHRTAAGSFSLFFMSKCCSYFLLANNLRFAGYLVHLIVPVNHISHIKCHSVREVSSKVEEIEDVAEKVQKDEKVSEPSKTGTPPASNKDAS